MNGKWPALVLIAATVAAGAGVWYAQQYGYYTRLAADGPDARVTATRRADGTAMVLPLTGFQGIDANSSPLRWRACFTLTDTAPGAADLLPYPDPTPLIGPRWFDCYDAARIGADLAAGRAVAVLGAAEIRPDVDRVLAIYPDGRAFGWHQHNDKTPERGVMD